MTEWLKGFVDEVAAYHGEEAAETAEQIISELKDRDLKLVRENDQGTKGIGLQVVVPRIQWEPTPVVSHGKTGTMGWELPNLRRGNPFKSDVMEQQLRERLGAIPGMDLSYPHYPKTSYRVLHDEAGVPPLLDVLDWTVARLHGSNRV